MGLFERVASYLLRSKEDNPPAARPGRNEPCWCGSGQKYKKCHLADDEKASAKACTINCGPT